jgi:hypothetical protein
VITLGYRREEAESFFETCELAAQISNGAGVKNQESARPDIFVCRQPRQAWPILWQALRHFG